MSYPSISSKLLELIPSEADVLEVERLRLSSSILVNYKVEASFSEEQERLREIESCLVKYRAGNSKTAERLLELFDPYIRSWVGFLRGVPRKGGAYDMFLRDPRFRPIPGDHRSKHILISKSLTGFTREDLHGEVVLAFLQACLNSENVTSGVAYYLASSIYNIIKDPANFGGRCFTIIDALNDKSDIHEMLSSTGIVGIGEQDDLVYLKELRTAFVEVGDCGFTDLIRVFQRADGLMGAAISNDWVQGLTVGLGGEEAFITLTPQERELVLRFYVAHQKHEEIALDMNISHRHSRTLLARARRKLGLELDYKPSEKLESQVKST